MKDTRQLDTSIFKSKREEGLFDLARQIAELSTSRFRVGAVIARRSHPLSLGVNDMLKTHPKRKPRYGCAEFYAIKRARTSVEGADIYVVRIRRNGSLGLARPCIMCALDLQEVGITRVFYSTEYGIQRIAVDNLLKEED